MGKGKSHKRRALNAQRARQGNLALAQLGKGSYSLPLPTAPTAKELVDKPPASLRKMLALKEAANKQQKRTPAATERSQQQSAAQKGDEPSTSGRGASASTPHAAAAGCTGKQQHQEQQGQEQDSKAQQNLFEQAKKLKPRKKEYLKNKALKKKSKKLARMQEVLERERGKDHVAFGERVEAPLAVNLKRKHWADAEKAAAERCKAVFLRQMEMAQKRAKTMSGAAADGAAAAAMQARLHNEAEGPAGQGPRVRGRGGKKGQEQQGSRAHLQDEEHKALRQQVIDAYRSKRKTQPVEGAANLGSLKRLVV